MKNPSKRQSRVDVQIPASMRADLEAIAKRDDRTLSNVVRIALQRFVNAYNAARNLRG